MRIFSFLIGAAFLGAMPAMTAPVPAESTFARPASGQRTTCSNTWSIFRPYLVEARCRHWRIISPTNTRPPGFRPTTFECVPYDSTDPVAKVTDKTAALIVRWRAPGKPKGKPIMLMGHMDVVEAKREDSTTDPFVLTERDGYYYGRGTIDMKDGIVGITQAIFDLKAAGFKPTARHRGVLYRRRGNQRHRCQQGRDRVEEGP